MPTPHSPITFTDLMEKTGLFMFSWSRFEQELGKVIVMARERSSAPESPVRGGLKERLDMWAELVVKENANFADKVQQLRTQALELRDIRNTIVHGLAGANAIPEFGGVGYIRCAVGGFENPTGAFIDYTAHDLDRFIRGADACTSGCHSVDAFSRCV